MYMHPPEPMSKMSTVRLAWFAGEQTRTTTQCRDEKRCQLLVR